MWNRQLATTKTNRDVTKVVSNSRVSFGTLRSAEVDDEVSVRSGFPIDTADQSNRYSPTIARSSDPKLVRLDAAETFADG